MVNTKPRLICCGDSFVDWPEPEGKHWTNILESNYNVINLGVSGSSNEEIIFQLGNLPSYKEGDRIVMIFTEPSRIPKWYWYDKYDVLLKNQSGDYSERSQYVDSLVKLRTYKWELLKEPKHSTERNSPVNLYKFINVLHSLLKDWKPVFLTWCPTDFLPDNTLIKYYDRSNYTTLKQELGEKYDDQHPGIEGNKKWAKKITELLNT